LPEPVIKTSGRRDFDTLLENLRVLHAGAHFVRGRDETVSVLRGILTGASSVVLAGLPPPVETVVREALGGITCTRVEELGGSEPARLSLSTADIGITWAQFVVTSTGAIVEVVQDDAQKLASCLPETHVAMVSSSALIPDLGHAMSEVGRMISSSPPDRRPIVSFISGPSETGDIEMQLLYGVHGPHAVHVLVLGWI